MVFAVTMTASGNGVFADPVTLAYVLVGFLVSGLIFGFITRPIARKKGYSHGFAWGFFLGAVGLLFMVFRIDRTGLTDEELLQKKLDLIDPY